MNDRLGKVLVNDECEQRARRALTDEERADIAIASVTVGDSGHLPSVADLAAQFVRDEHTIRQARLDAFKKQLVRVHRCPPPQVFFPRNNELERQLLQRHHKLKSALVVDISPLNHCNNSYLALDDATHRALGHVLADFIAEGQVFTDGSVIGVGAGRGVYYTVDALSAKRSPLYRDRVTVVSLTGSVEARDYMEVVARYMDADVHARALAGCFFRATHSQIWSPITRQDSAHPQATQLAADTLNSVQPTHALVGVGVLASGHRFYREVQNPAPNSALGPIRADLKDLVDFSEYYGKNSAGMDYCAVGDICHRFFLVPPIRRPAGAPECNSRTEEDAAQIIDRINSRIVTVSESQLRSIPDTLVVAGTRRKAFAIRELLNNGKYNITLLCTDSGAAQVILNG